MSAKHSGTHSALPWILGNVKRTDVRLQWCTISDAWGNPVAKAMPIHAQGKREAGDFDTEQANAAYIVRCVNSHEQLVNALERIVARLSEQATDGDEKQDAAQIAQDALDIARGESNEQETE